MCGGVGVEYVSVLVIFWMRGSILLSSVQAFLCISFCKCSVVCCSIWNIYYYSYKNIVCVCGNIWPYPQIGCELRWGIKNKVATALSSVKLNSCLTLYCIVIIFEGIAKNSFPNLYRNILNLHLYKYFGLESITMFLNETDMNWECMCIFLLIVKSCVPKYVLLVWHHLFKYKW